MSGTVALIADQSARYTEFFRCLTGLFAHLPSGTVVDWEVGADRGRSRNTLVYRALERKSDWVFFLDDDHTYPPTILDVLLSRNMPVVASLYLQRTDPFLPIAYAEKDESGSYWPLDLGACPEHGLVTVAGAGTGGMLIKSDVFTQIPGPWFIHTTQQSEDLYFCDLVRAAGIQMYVDLDARLGHIAPTSYYPDYEDGQWCAGITTSPSMKVLLPINMPTGEAPAGTPGEFVPPDELDSSPETNEELPIGPLRPHAGAGAPVATRVELFPDADGRWHARGVTETGDIVDAGLVTFNRDSCEQQARLRWPGLEIYELSDESVDSTFNPPDPMRMGMGFPHDSARGKLKRVTWG